MNTTLSSEPVHYLSSVYYNKYKILEESEALQFVG